MSDDWRGMAIGGMVGDARYELVKHVGSGAEAPVWEARALAGSLPQRVAVKVFSPEADHELRGLLEEQAQQGRYLGLPTDHPNLVGFHDYFQGGPPRPGGVAISTAMNWRYLVCTFVDGTMLSQYAKRQRGDLRPIASAARGLAVLHERKLVHGDVKPANIMVQLTTAGPVGVVVDLGTIRKFGTTTNNHLGTRNFTPAQQCQEPARPEHDAYALAMTALAAVDEAGVRDGRSPAELLEDLRQQQVSLDTLTALDASIRLEPLTEGIAARFASFASEQHATQPRRRRPVRHADPPEGPDPDELGATKPLDPSEIPLPPTVVMPESDWAIPPADASSGLSPVGPDGLPIRPGPGHPLYGWHLTWYDACVWLLRPRNLPASVVGAVLAGVFLGLVLSTVT